MDRRLVLLAEMTPAIWVHLVAATLALVLGALVLWRKKGDATHRFWGRIWVALMFIVAVSSFFITTIRDDGFSPIHALSVYTLFSLVVGLRAIRGRPANIKAHRLTMQTLYASALLIAGGFTFLPFRMLGRLTFGEVMPLVNYGIVAVMVSLGVWLIWYSYRVARP